MSRSHKVKRGDEALIQATNATLEKLGITMQADRFPGSARSSFDGSSQTSGRGTVQLVDLGPVDKRRNRLDSRNQQNALTLSFLSYRSC